MPAHLTKTVTLSLALCLTLSACVSVRLPIPPQATPEAKQASQNGENGENTENSEASAKSLPAIEPERDLSEPQPNISPPLPAQASAPKVETVFDRMRAGFRLPEFESSYVAEYLDWKTGHPTYLENLFNRARPFLPHLVKEVEARGLPMEIVLLPAVESAFKPSAISRSKAAGLWQFIPSTGRSFGLEQNAWYDGRKDALRATTAALDYLQELNAMFNGDWWLSLAAYNAGPGTIKRALNQNKKQGKPQQFQHLTLRSETRRYIPKLIALRHIVQMPNDYRVSLPEITLDDGFAVLELNQQIDLRKFAEQSQIDLHQLQHLNASFKRWATPPNGRYTLLVPQPHPLSITRLNAIVARESTLDFHPVKIDRGDNLSTLARRYKVSIKDIQRANNLRGSRIRAGQTLLIPVINEQGARALSRQQAVNDNSDAVNQRLVHTVQQGDTLWSISRRYKVGINQLLEWNQLAVGQILRLNQQLLVLLN